MLAFTLDFPDFGAGIFLNSKHRSIGIKGPYDEKSSLSETKHNPGKPFLDVCHVVQSFTLGNLISGDFSSNENSDASASSLLRPTAQSSSLFLTSWKAPENFEPAENQQVPR